MADIKPFVCIRPNENVASKVAALPYDVYNRQEAKIEVEKEPLSFLKIDRAETQFDDSVDIYSDVVYDKARQLLDEMIDNGTFITDNKECYYIYELIMNGRSQTGIVACASIDDYLNNTIKKHENTRADKEIDRIRHVDACNAQTGPIFLAYRSNNIINNIVDKTKNDKPIYSFVTLDNVSHNVWKISNDNDINDVKNAFKNIDNIYIADGHHRAASAVKVGIKRRQENEGYSGKEEFNYFLSVLFPNDQLMIMSYNRVVKDLNGLTKEQFLDKVSEYFEIKEIGDKPYQPDKKATFGMYIDNIWYMISAKQELLNITDTVKSLDVSLLQDYLLNPILNIKNPKTDDRIDFVGGIRGLAELEKRVHEDMKIAFSMHPTSIDELFNVADDNKLMPPKSTWFEPKLRSGLFIHKL